MKDLFPKTWDRLFAAVTFAEAGQVEDARVLGMAPVVDAGAELADEVVSLGDTAVKPARG